MRLIVFELSLDSVHKATLDNRRLVSKNISRQMAYSCRLMPNVIRQEYTKLGIDLGYKSYSCSLHDQLLQS